MTADALVQLRDALVNAFPDPPEARELAERAGFAEGSLPIDQHDMRGWWWAALHEAWRQGILVALVERAIADEVIGPELKQPFVELLAPITQVQARPAPRPHGVRVLITAGASLLIIAALALGAVWLNAPDEMTDLTRPFNIAVAEFGHLTPEGQTVSSDVERRMSRLIFEAFRDGGEDPPLVWHDSLPWWQKRTPLDVVTGATWEEHQDAARALAYRVGANLVIYGGEMEGGNDRWMGVRFYARELAEGEELIGEYQLGEPIRLLQADIAQPGLEEEMIARARIYYLFANALNHEAYRRYAAARADLEAAAAVPGWEDRQGIEVLYYYIGRELLEGKEYDEALAAFDRANVENEDYARPYLGRGEVYRRRAEPLPEGQADEKLALLDLATVEYERAIGIASESPGSGIEVKARLDLAATHQLKAGIRSEQGQLQQAMDELDQAGEQAGMALSLVDETMPPGDLASQLRAICLYDLAAASHRRAFLWCQTGDMTQARDHYETARELFGACRADAAAVTEAKSEFVNKLLDDCTLHETCALECVHALPQGEAACTAPVCTWDCKAEEQR